MATATITPDQSTIIAEIFIAAGLSGDYRPGAARAVVGTEQSLPRHRSQLRSAGWRQMVERRRGCRRH
jgi:hypothetical protein